MYAVRGSSTTPFGAGRALGGATVAVPVGAPARTQRAIRSSCAGVSRLAVCPTNGFESFPGGHGGITPARVAASISAACALASPALVSANGATPPTVWQPAHFVAKIGATSAYVGAASPLTAE